MRGGSLGWNITANSKKNSRKEGDMLVLNQENLDESFVGNVNLGLRESENQTKIQFQGCTICDNFGVLLCSLLFIVFSTPTNCMDGISWSCNCFFRYSVVEND